MPRPPLEALGMTDTSLTLKWTEPESDGGSPITHYLVERRELGKKAWQKCGESSEVMLEITSLKKEVSYHFRVFAWNAVGASPPFSPEEPIVMGKRISELSSI